MLQRVQDNSGNISAYRKTIVTRETITEVRTIEEVRTITVAHEEPGKYRTIRTRNGDRIG